MASPRGRHFALRGILSLDTPNKAAITLGPGSGKVAEGGDRRVRLFHYRQTLVRAILHEGARDDFMIDLNRFDLRTMAHIVPCRSLRETVSKDNRFY